MQKGQSDSQLVFSKPICSCGVPWEPEQYQSMYSTAKENCIMQWGVLPSDVAGSHNFIMHDIMEQDPEITHQILDSKFSGI